MRIAVVVTTYNRPDALAAVLEGYLAQRDRGFELIVADDGSTDETRQVADKYRLRAGFDVRHVWHEDRGFRAGTVRNLALAATTADYVVFTDGDCIPLPGFVGGHRRLAERGWFVAGSRILLSEWFTRRVLREWLPVHVWGAARFVPARLTGGINRLLPMLRLPMPRALACRGATRWEGARTCNLAAWRDDLLAVNGFDEAYSGWGLEDSDLALRLIHSGVLKKSARWGAPLLHLWHRENPRDRLPENRRMLDELIRSRRTRATLGVHQYLDRRAGGVSPRVGARSAG